MDFRFSERHKGSKCLLRNALESLKQGIVMREEFEDIDLAEDNEQESEEGFAKAAAAVWDKETAKVEQNKTGCGYTQKRWCAPPPFVVRLDTGDTRVLQQTSAQGSHTDRLEMSDKAEIEVAVPWGTAEFNTPENVRVKWADGKVEVRLPDGTTFSPQGDFTVVVNGKPVMTVSYKDGQTSVTRPNGHVVTFDDKGLIGVSSQNGGVINHANLRVPGKLVKSGN